MTFFENSYEQINGDGDPHLDSNDVLRSAVEGFDSQMLFDPFEEEFNVPTAAVKLGDIQRRFGEIVGEKHIQLFGFRIAKTDSAQHLGIVSPRIKAAQDDSLVTAQSRGLVDRTRIAPSAFHVFFGSGDEEGSLRVQSVKTTKVEISPIEDVKRSCFEAELIEDVDVVNFASRDNDYSGKVASQVEQRVQFDSGLVTAKLGPREEREAEIDGGGVQCISVLFQFDAKGFVGVKSQSLLNQHLSKVGEDAPVAFFVGVGQGAASDRMAQTAVVEFGANSVEASGDVAQTLAIGELGKSHGQKLFVSGERAHATVAAVASDTLVQFVLGQLVHELSKHGSSFVHNGQIPLGSGGRPCKRAAQK